MRLFYINQRKLNTIIKNESTKCQKVTVSEIDITLITQGQSLKDDELCMFSVREPPPHSQYYIKNTEEKHRLVIQVTVRNSAMIFILDGEEAQCRAKLSSLDLYCSLTSYLQLDFNAYHYHYNNSDENNKFWERHQIWQDSQNRVTINREGLVTREHSVKDLEFMN